MGSGCVSCKGIPPETNEKSENLSTRRLVPQNFRSLSRASDNDNSGNVSVTAIQSKGLGWNAKLDQLWMLRAKSQRKIEYYWTKLKQETEPALAKFYQDAIEFYHKQIEEIDRLIGHIRISNGCSWSQESDEMISLQYRQIVRTIRTQERKYHLKLTGSKDDSDDDF
ncbi:hypothetical protein RFI_08327 [Reticulomyxa filosa]|uniref:Uncharacterized protein n=1 Tax=Reticulomyxa filosa TaxID=46433 RepID=X6NS86_RETFI|nr:hypothetical protein RFI_08327 [Reticulomyxa filosa]|eukprot:ETO28798.1 hypothetical protein RFI_08327 [Reticulomyxa filosa]